MVKVVHPLSYEEAELEGAESYFAKKPIYIKLTQTTNFYGLKSILTCNANIVFIIDRNGAGDYICDFLDDENILWR